SRGGEAVANYEDVADHEGAGRMVAQAVDTWGQLDVLVNNAGIVRDGAIWNMADADFDAVVRVHVKGTWSPSHWAARHWRQRAKDGETFTGRIINTTSGAGLVGNFGQTNYATAKAAIAGLTQTLSLELYKLGVTVNAVGPAGATRITATMPGAPAVIEPDDLADDEWNPMDPAVSSPLVAWLASDESQHVTGQVIRAVAEKIIWMRGWADGPTISNGGKRWDATTLGTRLNTDIFGTRTPGLRY
ncbi:MAG TPA: SDR family NAD(P)-dependent oxidoreductase, partial [Acidimicrobiales bacterium]|nr:SDR family NAD(P)-dependent oxidoreductase [Acidimicrobiales bacterium]